MFKTSIQACDDWICPMMCDGEGRPHACRGTQCAMWRLTSTTSGEEAERVLGYCGLAGEVQLLG